MIRGRTGDAGRRLNHIEPVHRVTRATQLAAAREFSRVADVSRAATQEIGIERKDDIGLFREIHRVEVVAKGKLRAFTRAVADGGLPLVPFGLRKKRKERLNLRGQRRRSDDTGQDAETRAAPAFHPGREGLRTFHKQRPGLDFPEFRHRLRAIRIVKIQDRGLREHVRCAKAGRMVGVTFDFRRPSLVAFHQQADRIRPKRHGRGIKLRLAEGHPIGLLDVRHHVLLGRAAAAGETRKSQRCRHQLQEVTPVDGVVPFRRRLAREFAMQQLFELRITGEFLERAPVLLPGFRLEPGAYRGQIHRASLQLRLSGLIVMIVLAVEVSVLFVLAHTVH